MRKTLTDRLITSLRAPAGGRLDVHDTVSQGLSLRVGAQTKTWLVWLRVQGRLRCVTLGRYPRDLSLAQARQRARDARQQAAEGVDPGAAKVAARTPPTDTFGALVALYLEQHAAKHKRTGAEDARILRKDFADWSALPAGSLTRRMIRERLDLVAARAPVQANRALATLSTVLNFGVDREWLVANVAARLKKPTTEVSRERVLTPDELRALRQAIDTAQAEYAKVADLGKRVTLALMGATPLLRPLYGDWLWLRLLTAQRGGEVLRMRREDVDLTAAVWTIPATVAKNGIAHLVPLSPAARALVQQRLADIAPGCPWLFPNDRGTGPALDRAKKVSVSALLPDVPDVRGHDLRRTAASGMGRLGVARDTISRILNHTDRGPRATSVYDRYDRLPEKRAALDLWAADVARLCAETGAGADTGSEAARA